MTLGMPVIVLQVSRLNDPGPFSLRDHPLYMPGGGLARMRSGARQIQDSQRGVINKSSHKEGGLPDFLSLFYFQTNTFSALGTNGTPPKR